MAMRILSETEYMEFKKKLTDFSDSPNREELTSKKLNWKICKIIYLFISKDNLISDIEKNLILIGATAVEDKL